MKYAVDVVCRIVIPVIVEADSEEEANETMQEAVRTHDFCAIEEIPEAYDTISVDRWMLENLAVAAFPAEPYEEE